MVKRVGCLLILLLATSAASADQDEEQAPPLVVMINGFYLEGIPKNGAGIIVGRSQKEVFILTAGHVVRPLPNAELTDIKVTLRIGSRDAQFSAKIEDHDDKLDVAVLSFPLTEEVRNYVDGLRFECMIDPKDLKSSEPLLVFGYPSGKKWQRGVATYLKSSGDSFDYDFPKIAIGNSGGGIFTAAWWLVGVVKTADSTTEKATSIVAATVWMQRVYPVKLALVPPVQIVSIDANSEVVDRDDDVVVSWKAINATDCQLDATEPSPSAVDATGTRTFRVSSSMFFRLECNGRGGRVNKSKMISVRLISLRDVAGTYAATGGATWQDASSCAGSADKSTPPAPDTTSRATLAELPDGKWMLTMSEIGGNPPQAVKYYLSLKYKQLQSLIFSVSDAIGWDTCGNTTVPASAVGSIIIDRASEGGIRLSGNLTFTSTVPECAAQAGECKMTYRYNYDFNHLKPAP